MSHPTNANSEPRPTTTVDAASADTGQLAALIASKRSTLEQVLDLSRRQCEVATAGDVSKMLSLLSVKDRLVRQLGAVEEQLSPFRDHDPDQRRWTSAAARQECRRDAERCSQLLREILVLERQSEAEMTRRRDETAIQLEGVHAAQQARRAYDGAGQQPPGPRTAFRSDA